MVSASQRSQRTTILRAVYYSLNGRQRLARLPCSWLPPNLCRGGVDRTSPVLSTPAVSPISYFAVYDGHGGPQASAYLAQNLHCNVMESLGLAARAMVLAAGSLDTPVTSALRDAFLKTDFQFLGSAQNPEHGSTATTVLILGQRLYCANVGDSRTTLSRNFSVVHLSSDHKPTRADEAKRIRDAGGYIIANRVMGELAVSRAIGDSNFKKSVKVAHFTSLRVLP